MTSNNILEMMSKGIKERRSPRQVGGTVYRRVEVGRGNPAAHFPCQIKLIRLYWW
jgi:hypothetical protein